MSQSTKSVDYLRHWKTSPDTEGLQAQLLGSTSQVPLGWKFRQGSKQMEDENYSSGCRREILRNPYVNRTSKMNSSSKCGFVVALRTWLFFVSLRCCPCKATETYGSQFPPLFNNPQHSGTLQEACTLRPPKKAIVKAGRGQSLLAEIS